MIFVDLGYVGKERSQKGDRGRRENAESDDQSPGKQIACRRSRDLYGRPFLPTNWEKNQNEKGLLFWEEVGTMAISSQIR